MSLEVEPGNGEVILGGAGEVCTEVDNGSCPSNANDCGTNNFSKRPDGLKF